MKVLICTLLICSYFTVTVKANNETQLNTDETDEQLNPNLKRVETVNALGELLIAKAIPAIIQKFDMNPFIAPDQSEFIFPINLKLRNINIYNLTSIKMVDDLIIMDFKEKKQMTAAVKMSFSDVLLTAKYNAFIKPPLLPGIGSAGVLTAHIQGMTVDVKATIDYKNVNATLTNLRLNVNKKRIRAKLSKNLESYLINPAMPAILLILQNILLRVIEVPLKKEINVIIFEIVNMIHSMSDLMNPNNNNNEV